MSRPDTRSARAGWAPARAFLATAALAALCLACAGDAPKAESESDPAGSQSEESEPTEQKSTKQKKQDKKRTVLLTTEYDDQRVGEEESKRIEAEMGVYDDPALAAYVERVGRRLIAFAPPRPFQYSFQIVDQMTPNAFALPGGHIYVSRGLLALASSEDELAAVLGHEIIHAAERHMAAQQELARRQFPLVMPYLRMAELAAYSRDHERAADGGGQQIAARAGYDPAGLGSFLVKLGNTERLVVGYSRIPGYFDTHPGTTERVASAATRTTTLDAATRDEESLSIGTIGLGQLGADDYLERIEGIILDTNPAEGIFRGQEFIHPDLDFRLLFPHDWQLVNTHQAVGAVAPQGPAEIFLTIQPGEFETAAAAAEHYEAEHEEGFRFGVNRSQPVRIGDIEGHRIDVSGSIGSQSVAGQITFIPHGGLMYRLMAVAPRGRWQSYLGRAHNVARSFRPLTDEERRSVEQVKLRVVAAQEGEGLTALGSRTGNAWDPGRTAVLNGVFVDARFGEGDTVKIARSAPYVPKPPSEEEEPTDGDDASE